ncbi:tRNA (adenosine(37)-N6)-threonylcarbamoyltransferase complex ATPase subunit type 1 TsaE [Devosia sp. 63-57]|uniref:tRNA (adenosine(37)-N6)-threonylcarbamoyltransferase complex ATPase subunit type 1 TsaE n=1 Tax=Devosia sp. 63-57 TaxID=1895751 RepID=UPI000869B87C|nr:tRNA (adenosine(37)-N6)-threonylcarbamoyltransferase complex ATPase subunit type 1 TsaE [Devosia sp. 63-57]ODT48226.1 MAG: tRNA (adenosine(37)-N6)-threonylcarbamoyltransferase complex ATPase subunit type 1 TsaE [Pelagibacterium sp. SCN 63-126]ODU84268.1 MAG: tRNA (adenosine(37)-N6)-threonylcarbamoyltransferase complex ATPase subunit type 1 TsaE [Pelagibacterium sp. SCN 63-17]OJX42063.1 MAG: tRNA (adenosine(37)-N6)-threonylcarbamoyltransferase complex ATPase subunit type 1 TsaE [Devosia sp. 63
MLNETFLPDDDATAAFGATLAATLQPGDIVRLEGDLGAGKTALARAVIRALAGDTALEVPSPTFAIVQPYDTPLAPVLHADLYRLADASEVVELGLLDDPEAIVLVEWAERAPEIATAASVVVTLAIPPGGNGRMAGVTRR